MGILGAAAPCLIFLIYSKSITDAIERDEITALLGDALMGAIGLNLGLGLFLVIVGWDMLKYLRKLGAG